MKNVIKVENLSKSYGKQKVLDNVSLKVSEGENFGLLGDNGAGKTTTIECIIGTELFDNGEISVLGMDPKISRKELFEDVGVQFQESSYQDKIKVEELCEITISLYKNTLDYKELLKKFGIDNRINNYVNELSGGQKQRLFIVLALIPNPKVVFLDELTTGLDARARREIWKIFLEFKKDGMAILLTSHFMDEVDKLCDVICILKDGKIVFYGSVYEAIKSSPYNNLEETYL
ncbi:ABC transporter ATP-binding protein [Peptostreptococcus faecalis]|uniref:ABC transporter ATP-binding protein n=1 Tax=Peptostreptococcus faecalis TaxID=2045015 RepID=UPI000C7DA86F|nr:ABC transporter ATP-binding protein [Peptostreptococcus faecalis]